MGAGAARYIMVKELTTCFGFTIDLAPAQTAQPTAALLISRIFVIDKRESVKHVLHLDGP